MSRALTRIPRFAIRAGQVAAHSYLNTGKNKNTTEQLVQEEEESRGQRAERKIHIHEDYMGGYGDS